MKNRIFKNLISLLSFTLLLTNLFAQDANKDEFKPSGKVWGLVFGDVYSKIHADSLNRGAVQYSNIPKDYSSFDFRRIYLGYDYNISEKFSTELILAYEANNDAGGNRTVLIKSANLRWKNIYHNADLVVGQSSTPCFSLLSEKIFGYRSVEKMPFDMRKFGSSNDVGIAVQGKIDKDGKYGYNLMLGNGTSTKPETDRFKKIYGEVYAKFFNQKLVVDLYSDWERVQLTPYHKSKQSFKVFVAYQTEKITAGIEASQQVQQNYTVYTDTITSNNADTGNVTGMLFSAFVRGSIIKDKLGFYLRYDNYNPNTDFNADYIYSAGNMPNTENFLMAGLNYSPHKNVHIMPNIWYDGFNNRTRNAKGVTKSDYDLVARITFYYLFK